MSFKKRLQEMNQQWDETSSGFQDLPEGQYTMQIAGAELKETQTGNLRASIQYVVAEGEMSGQSIYDGFMVEKDGAFFEIGAQMLKGWLERMGYEAPPLDEIEDTLAMVTQEAPMVLAEVKKKGDFTNVRVRERLDDGAAPAPAKGKRAGKTTQKPAAVDTDAPFSKGDAVQFIDDDGDAIIGTITAIDGDTCTVLSTEDEDWEDIPFDMLTLADSGGDDTEPEEEEPEEEEDGADTTDLLAFCGAHDLEGVDDGMTAEELVGIIDEYEWKASYLTDEEVELLEGINIAVKKGRGRRK